MSALWTAGLLAFLAIVSVGGAEGALWVVDDDGGGWANFTSVQNAVDAASSGDTIQVFAGTYFESVTVDVAVHIIGNGSDDTVIDAGGSGDVVILTVPHVNLSGLNLTGSGSVASDAGVHITSNFNTIEDCTIVGNKHGVLVDQKDGNTIVDCIISYNSMSGIYSERSDANVYERNNCSDNGDHGIYIYFSSFHNWVGNNTCDRNTIGIYLWFGSENNTLYNNTCRDNDEAGIELAHSDSNDVIANTCTDNAVGLRVSQSDGHFVSGNNLSSNSYGIDMENSDSCTISNNTISRNVNDAVNIAGSNLNDFSYNDIFWNGGYGIYIDSGSGNTVHHNNFFDNGGTSSQGYDGEMNSWDDGSEGNYWSDHGGTGSYSIDGIGGSTDDYPVSGPIDTSSPERVPEWGALTFVATALVALFSLRRRRYR